ncbi:hypothetical protein [Sphingobacterium faecale]|uniref:Uncharacterized protein n=1 Tax=Sphingobacterium faecale TaxID=2803775 RepID=A0ABS1R6Y0_9SPHI|nr:hypothetical protein [Sphingobacterium faecale]MBL1410457.1 hypothetical protein [Sphingobacterium faecale]
MAQKLYILFFVMIALFMGPQSIMARPVTATAKVCCKKMSSDKSCCKGKKTDTTKKHLCKGGCKACSCASHTVDVKTPLVSNISDEDITIEFLEKKQKHFYVENFHSNDARAIWLPPKIS